MPSRRLVVVGAGGWGTALAVLAVRGGHRATLWCRRRDLADRLALGRENVDYLPGVRIPPEVAIASDEKAFDAADAFLVTVPTQHLRATLSPLRAKIGSERPVLSCSKGIENGSLDRASEVVRETLGRAKVTVLSGPSHAEEVARGLPASLVVASKDEKRAEYWQKTLTGDTFRLYTSGDPAGVELGGALKNIIAIAAGFSDGLKLGDNAKAALISRGIVEMARLGTALGAKKQTFFGISGIGDLIATCMSPHGRNLRVGREVGAGTRVADVLGGMKMVAEGVWTSRAARDLGRKHKVDLPITEEVVQVLHAGRAPLEAFKRLMSRRPKSETGDLE